VFGVLFERTGCSVIGVQPVPDEEVIEPWERIGNLYQVKRFVEKLPRGTVPSNLDIMGCYILTPEIFDFLKKQ
jgi:UTP--glucose-1-phosphate uridylyltransferase